MNAFNTLVQLVKETKSGQVIVPEVRTEVEETKPKLEILEKAGFTAIHEELDRKVRSLEKREKQALLTNQLVNEGYLILDIPYYFKNGWNHKRSAFVKPIQKKITRTIEESNFWGTKSSKKEVHEWIPSGQSLVLCQHYNWMGDVPISVAETLIEFQEKHNLKNSHTDFHILSVLPSDQISRYVTQVDPLLLYSIDGHEGSQFAVLAWWGADIEIIEQELGLTKESFKAVKILEGFQ